MSERPFFIGSPKRLLASLSSGLRQFRQRLRYREAVPGSPKPTRSQFNATTTAETVTSQLDLSGQSYLVTGCNSGLGFETMRVLTRRGAHVFGTARSMEQAEQACSKIEGAATPLMMELTQFETIMRAGEEVKRHKTTLDGLILNAGVMQLQTLQLVYGMEKQFVVNHLGHFLLTRELIPKLTASSHARVITLSSRAYTWAPEAGIEFDNLDGSRSYDPRVAYGQSKLANALFARELARRTHAQGIRSNAVHPGVVEETRLHRHVPPSNDEPVVGDNRGYRIKSTEEGAATTCYVATHPALNEVSGYYFSDCNWEIPTQRMQDDQLAKRLWEFSETKVSEIVGSSKKA